LRKCCRTPIWEGGIPRLLINTREYPAGDAAQERNVRKHLISVSRIAMMTRIVVASIAEGLIKIMKGIAKWIVGIVVVVLLLVIAVMIVAVVVFDPDDYREVVAELVYDQTGRTLEIEGGLSINVLPCCSVALKETRLSNPEGFAETEFARVESVKLGMAWN
jgi:hypothetical protein